MSIEEMDKQIRSVSGYAEYLATEISEASKVIAATAHMDEWAMKMLIESLEDAATIIGDCKELLRGFEPLDIQISKRKTMDHEELDNL